MTDDRTAGDRATGDRATGDREVGAAGPERAEREFPTLMEQMGGVQGIVASSIPVVVFVLANLLFTVQVAVIAALVAGVAIAVWRIVRRQPLQPAVSGLLGVGIAAFIAYRTGEARGFYLPGLIYSGVLAVAFLGSVLVRRPLAGVIWHGINGDGQGWRDNPALLRAYTGPPCCGPRCSSPAWCCRASCTSTTRRPGSVSRGC